MLFIISFPGCFEMEGRWPFVRDSSAGIPTLHGCRVDICPGQAQRSLLCDLGTDYHGWPGQVTGHPLHWENNPCCHHLLSRNTQLLSLSFSFCFFLSLGEKLCAGQKESQSPRICLGLKQLLPGWFSVNNTFPYKLHQPQGHLIAVLPGSWWAL